MVPHRVRDECGADPDLDGPGRCVAEGPRNLVTLLATHRTAPNIARDADLCVACLRHRPSSQSVASTSPGVVNIWWTTGTSMAAAIRVSEPTRGAEPPTNGGGGRRVGLHLCSRQPAREPVGGRRR